MLIKLNKNSPKVGRFIPPFAIPQTFEDHNPEDTIDDQIVGLLWIPATIVARFLGQFPFLENEQEELFSIGLLTVTKVVNSGKHKSNLVGAVCHVSCVRAMEDYCNNLDSVVLIATSTRYLKRNARKEVPSHCALPDTLCVTDDHLELEIRDAAEVLGYDIDSLTLKQKRKLYRLLA